MDTEEKKDAFGAAVQQTVTDNSPSLGDENIEDVVVACTTEARRSRRDTATVQILLTQDTGVATVAAAAAELNNVGDLTVTVDGTAYTVESVVQSTVAGCSDVDTFVALKMGNVHGKFRLGPKLTGMTSTLCAGKCLERSNCVGYSFSGELISPTTCFLTKSVEDSAIIATTGFHRKFTVHTRIKATCTTTATTTTSTTPEPGVCEDTFDGGVLGLVSGNSIGDSVKDQTYESCAAACLADSRCVTFSYGHSTSSRLCYTAKSADDKDVLARTTFHKKFMTYRRVPNPCGGPYTCPDGGDM